MDHAPPAEDKFYIMAGTSLADHRSLVLKHGDTFAVFGAAGDADSDAHHEEGLFTAGMRHLSRLEVKLMGQCPLLLSSAVSRDNSRLFVDLTNPDLTLNGRLALARGTVHLARTRHLRAGAWFERLTISNFGRQPLAAVVSFEFEADFADIFEIRGTPRSQRGTLQEPEITGHSSVLLTYDGLDSVTRTTRFEFEPAPAVLSATEAHYRITLAPNQAAEIFLTIRTTPCDTVAPLGYRASVRQRARERETRRNGYCSITSSSAQLNQWVRRSLADVRMLITDTPEGPYPFAGIPWYSCPFGRDGIITALQLLWVNPDIARGVLSFLAANQADAHDPANDAEPGKILHEWRSDEMANTREVPFGRYYGTVDATPLFVLLAGSYYAATADRSFCERLWPHVERAIAWIDQHGDADRDGFVEYESKTSEGLSNQGWKDSGDAVFHADGSLAVPPIALCEVQAYVYEAKVKAASLARALGLVQRADELEHQARILKSRFHEFFWSPQIGSYALALDGLKRPCAIRTSNAGQCLFTGIADAAAAAPLAESLLSRDMYSGWGVRTVSELETRYNPMSYHNGTVWPHDNSLIAQGLARYGFNHHALTLFKGFLDASTFFDLHRLPELYCGFRRRPGNGPTQYPVACSPQAWAAGSVFMLLAATLGLTVDGARKQVRIVRPLLPAGLQRLDLTGLRVGKAVVDIEFHHEVQDVSVVVRRRTGEVTVQVEK